jgi:hypothetical protein
LQVGILLADGRNGPFRFEIQHIRAIRDYDPADYSSLTMQLIEARQAEEQRLLAEAATTKTKTAEELKEYYKQQREKQKLQ